MNRHIFTPLRWAAAALCCCLLLASAPLAAGAKLNMAYLYGAAGGSTAAVARADGTLDEVSPGYFELNPDGSLKLTGGISRSAVAQLQAQGVRVVPFLSNHWDRELGAAALENREALARQLAEAVAAYGLDGVSLDLENMTAEHRQPYVELAQRLRSLLPAGKTLAVAVAANPRNFTTGWHASYDYSQLADAADYLMIMAYDEHYRGSAPGPVASRAFVERSIAYALDRAPAEKIVLGIPLYGRIWNDAGGEICGIGISDRQIETLLQQFGGSVTYDTAQQAAVARITIPGGGTTVSVAGYALTPGSYTIWYADEQAKKGLLALADTYDLRGAGSWSLGQETEATWDYFSLWLNGCFWEDLQGHWARQHAVEANASGLMQGVSASRFVPDRTLTRAEAAAVLCRLLDLPGASGAAPDFGDTAGHWARAEIAAAAEAGLVEGTGGGQFRPDVPVTREQLAVMLYRAAELAGADVSGMADLSGFSDSRSISAYAKAAMAWAVDAGLLTGSGGRLSPGSGATRAQTAALLNRFQEAVPARQV